MKKAGLVLVVLAVVTGAVWFLETATAPEPVAEGEPSPGEISGLPVPELLEADVAGQKVHLRWRSVPGALTYNLWRATGPDAVFAIIYSGRDTIFTDGPGLVPGQDYCYQLTAVDPEFDESGFSDQICVVRNPASR